MLLVRAIMNDGGNYEVMVTIWEWQ